MVEIEFNTHQYRINWIKFAWRQVLDLNLIEYLCAIMTDIYKLVTGYWISKQFFSFSDVIWNENSQKSKISHNCRFICFENTFPQKEVRHNFKINKGQNEIGLTRLVTLFLSMITLIRMLVNFRWLFSIHWPSNFNVI